MAEDPFPTYPDYSSIKNTFKWKDWRWQLSNSITEFPAVQGIKLPFRVTPYYADLLYRLGPFHPLNKTVFPSAHELVVSPGEAVDPLGEEHDSPVPGLVHRYPDRVLFLVANSCAMYCRYCTRSRAVGHGEAGYSEETIDYIRKHTEIRDVVISGGDPLTLPTDQIELILSRLFSIPHIEMIRIGTKVPMVLPMRVDPDLRGVLQEYHPWISIHCTHPDELTPEASAALNRLANCGCPLGSQTVLLKGVNDAPEVMQKLMTGLLRNRVRPYYIYACDPVVGTQHFRCDPDVGVGILRHLQGKISGYGIPRYVIDAPTGGGKIPLAPQYVIGRDENEIRLENWEGKEFGYPIT